MNKPITFLFIGSMAFSLVLASVVLADSTIGTNISTTGTLKVTTGGTTAVQFQNAAGTNLFIFDHTNLRLGIGATPGTTFEVQGTASASYFLTGNTIQVGGFSSVAYSRFGTSTTNHANYISTTNDLLVSGDVEIRGSVSFGGTASVSGIFFMNDGRHRPNTNSATAFRFQNAAGSTDVLTIDTTNTRVGVNAGGAVDTTFEVGGAASISGAVTLGSTLTATSGLTSLSNASVSDRFELTSSTGRLGINAGAFTDTAFEVGGVASVGTNFQAGESSTATTSITFKTSATNKGACIVMTDTAGTVRYLRLFGNTLTINTTDCR